MWNKSKNIVLITLLLWAVQACKTVQEISGDEKVTAKIETDSLQKILIADTIDYQYLFTKIDVSLKSPDRNISFDLSTKFTKDSALLTNVTFFNIIVASALFNQDSLYLSNKKDKCHMEKSIDELASIINADIGYSELQSIIAGKIPYYQPDDNWQQLKRDNFYVLSTHSDKEIKKLLEKTPSSELTRNDRIFRYFFSPSTKKIKACRIDIPKDTLTIFTEYLEEETIDGIAVPKNSSITIEKAGAITAVKLKYKRTRLNEPRELYYYVPDSYEACP